MQLRHKIDSNFDTVVVGGGVVGLCLTWFLAREGVEVLCLNDGRHSGSTANAGSLHGQMQSRLIQMFPKRVPDFEKTLSIYPRAIDYWTEIADQLDDDIEISICGGLMVAENDTQMKMLADKCRLERRNGIETSLLGRSELLQLAPYLNPDIKGAVLCPKEGKLNPLLANAAIRRQALRHNGTIADNSRVDFIERAKRGFIVACGERKFLARRVVIAAGAGSGALAATLGIRLPMTAEPLHMNISEPIEPFMQHVLQHAERPITMKQTSTGQLVIGGGWPAQLGNRGSTPTVVLESLFGNLRLAQHIVPGIHGIRVIRTWAGINPMLDLISVLGEVESLPGIYFAIPGDAGYTLAPYCAALVVDAMLGRAPDYPVQQFSHQRF